MGSGKWTNEKVYASLMKRLRFYVAAGISPFPTFGDVPARGPNLPSPTSGGSVRRPSAGRLWTGRPVDFSPPLIGLGARLPQPAVVRLPSDPILCKTTQSTTSTGQSGT